MTSENTLTDSMPSDGYVDASPEQFTEQFNIWTHMEYIRAIIDEENKKLVLYRSLPDEQTKYDDKEWLRFVIRNTIYKPTMLDNDDEPPVVFHFHSGYACNILTWITAILSSDHQHQFTLTYYEDTELGSLTDLTVNQEHLIFEATQINPEDNTINREQTHRMDITDVYEEPSQKFAAQPESS